MFTYLDLQQGVWSYPDWLRGKRPPADRTQPAHRWSESMQSVQRNVDTQVNGATQCDNVMIHWSSDTVGDQHEMYWSETEVGTVREEAHFQKIQAHNNLSHVLRFWFWFSLLIISTCWIRVGLILKWENERVRVHSWLKSMFSHAVYFLVLSAQISID